MAVKIRVYGQEVEIENGVVSCENEVVRGMAVSVARLRPADYEPDPDFAAADYVAKRLQGEVLTELRQPPATGAIY